MTECPLHTVYCLLNAFLFCVGLDKPNGGLRSKIRVPAGHDIEKIALVKEVRSLITAAHYVTNLGIFACALTCIHREIEQLGLPAAAEHFRTQYGRLRIEEQLNSSDDEGQQTDGSTISKGAWSLATAEPGWPTSNNAVESCNRDIKETMTERKILRTEPFLNALIDYLYMRSREEESSKVFKTWPKLEESDWKSAAAFSTSMQYKHSIQDSNGYILVPSSVKLNSLSRDGKQKVHSANICIIHNHIVSFRIRI